MQNHMSAANILTCKDFKNPHNTTICNTYSECKKMEETEM